MAELYSFFIEEEIIIVSLGANFLILDAREVITYKTATPKMFEEVMSQYIGIC